MVSLNQLQEVPLKSMILLVGAPGSGKSTFCHQVILRNIEARPIIYVTTEAAPSKVLDSLRQRGLGEVLPHSLSFVFATERKEPCCYFTTGFLNGFFSAVKNEHVKETKCIAMGDSYCEWEFR